MNDPLLTKRCNLCQEHLSVDLFHRAKRGLHKRQGACKECSKARSNAYRAADPEKALGYNRRYLAEARQAIFDALGNKCAACGYCENPLGIEIDHVEEDGHVERRSRKAGESRVTTYRNMLKDISAGTARLQLLCGTCHCIKTQTAKLRKTA